MGAAARNASVQFATVDDRSGVVSIDDVLEVIDAERDHQPHVSMVSLENTHMYSGGTPIAVEDLDRLAAAVGDRAIHLDGARLLNAAVASGTSAARFAQSATTVMCCLSKGLCAPIGSLLAGPVDVMARARVERKRLGGAMRQSGIVAAAGLVALRTMVDRLAEDHVRARVLADAVAAAFPESGYDATTCRTNIVAFDHPHARHVVAALGERGVLGDTIGPRRVRLVTHADVTDDDLDYAIEVLAHLAL